MEQRLQQDKNFRLLMNRSSGAVPLEITNSANTTVVPQGSGVYRVTKTGGVDGAWDASALSAVGIVGDFLLRISPLQITKDIMAGVALNPTLDNSFTSIDRDIRMQPAGGFDTGEFGGASASGPYVVGDRLFLRRIGTTFEARKGPSDDIAASLLVFTHSNLVGTVFFDSSLNGLGGAFDIYMVAL